jgi:hypothetical protein
MACSWTLIEKGTARPFADGLRFHAIGDRTNGAPEEGQAASPVIGSASRSVPPLGGLLSDEPHPTFAQLSSDPAQQAGSLVLRSASFFARVGCCLVIRRVGGILVCRVAVEDALDRTFPDDSVMRVASAYRGNGGTHVKLDEQDARYIGRDGNRHGDVPRQPAHKTRRATEQHSTMNKVVGDPVSVHLLLKASSFLGRHAEHGQTIDGVVV